MEETDIIIIGAGVVGLSIAAQVAKENTSVLVDLKINLLTGLSTLLLQSQVL